MKKIFVWAVCASLLICVRSFAWDDYYTHPHITEEALKASAFDDYLKTVLHVSDGIDYKLHSIIKKDYNIVQWFQYGSTQEDRPVCRASNHFHNPLKSWDQSGLTDGIGFSDWICRDFDQEYTPDRIKSNISWATGFKDPVQPDNDARSRNRWDWQSARDYFYIYLTGNAQYTDYDQGVIYLGEPANNQALADCFRSLGQVLHLLQDTAVPAHVRNDFSKGHNEAIPESLKLLGLEGLLSKILAGKGNMFEVYTSKTFSEGYMINKKAAPAWFIADMDKMNLTEKTLTNFWDTDNYKGTADSMMSNLKRIGLAEYTNHNFVSAATIFTEDKDAGDEHYFPYPGRESIEDQLEAYGYNDLEPVTVLRDGVLGPLKYVISTVTSHGEKITHFVTPSYLSKTLYEEMERGDNQYYQLYHIYTTSFRLDSDCFADQAQILIPRAIAYSAGLLDYFFRGRLEIREAVPVLKDHNIQMMMITVRNTTPTEESLTGGIFTLSCRYTPEGGKADGSEDRFIQSYGWSCDSLAYNQEKQRMLFTFRTPVPEKAVIKQITLAWRGKLGAEEGAVIGAAMPFTGSPAGYRFGETVFSEEWDGNGLIGNHNWVQEKSPAGNGTASVTAENGLLKMENIRYAGSDGERLSVIRLTFENPLLITPDTYIQHRTESMTSNLPDSGYQYFVLKFDSGNSLAFTRTEGDLYYIPYT